MIIRLSWIFATGAILGSLIIARVEPSRMLCQPKVYLAYTSTLPAQCKDGCSLAMVNATVGWLYSKDALWATADGGKKWHRRLLPKALGLGDVIDTHFIDERRGWLLASSRLYETSDGAYTWNSVQLPSFDGVILSAWSLPDGQMNWLGGGIYRPRKTPDAANYALKKYESGGWGILHPVVFIRNSSGEWNKYKASECSWQINRIEFWNTREGFAVGDNCFYYTVTGGQKWIAGLFTAPSESGPRYPEEGQHPTVFFLDRANGWLGLDDGTLYRTNDGGKRWIQIASSDLLRLSALRFVDQMNGFAIGSGTELYHSIDGGVTWLSLRTDFIPQGIATVSSGEGWVLSSEALYRLTIESPN